MSSSILLKPLSLLALALILAGCEANTAPAPKSERPVQTQRVTFDSREVARDFVGIVRARFETDLGFRVAGKIVSRTVSVGDRVRAGDVIARIDTQDLRLQFESSQAEFTAANSVLAQTTADFARYATLRDRGYASVAEFDRKQATKGEAEGRLERAKRALEIARNQLAYTELKVDADGVITATPAEPGQVVAVGQAVARLAQQGEKEAVVALPENWLGDARRSKATVRLWSDRDRLFRAQLRELSPQADPATRTYAARFTIDQADDTVAFGMTATVTLSHAADAEVARLPLSAILNRGTGPSVYVVNQSGTLEQRPVNVASFTEDQALVTSGIGAGENVVTLGVNKLEAGLKVKTSGLISQARN